MRSLRLLLQRQKDTGELFQTMFRQFLSDDRVVIPKMKASSGLVLGNAEFSVDVILHTVVVAIKMVRMFINTTMFAWKLYILSSWKELSSII